MLGDGWCSMDKAVKLLSHWDNRAAVRTKPRSPVFIDEEGYFFDPCLVPLLAHPRFSNASSDLKRELSILQLSRYLFDTENMETQIVNPALLAIQRLPLPRPVKTDAYKIYTDEGYHTLMSAEARQKIHCETGVAEIALPVARTQMGILDQIAALPASIRDAGLFCAAAVNETLISANLAQANDRRLIPAVRKLIADHADDEAVHHVFFSSVFETLWRQWPREEQVLLAPVIVNAMSAFLAADSLSLAEDLKRIGLAKEQAMKISSETVASSTMPQPPLDGTLKMLRRAGALELVDQVRAEGGRNSRVGV